MMWEGDYCSNTKMLHVNVVKEGVPKAEDTMDMLLPIFSFYRNLPEPAF